MGVIRSADRPPFTTLIQQSSRSDSAEFPFGALQAREHVDLLGIGRRQAKDKPDTPCGMKGSRYLPPSWL